MVMPDKNFWKNKRVFITGNTGFKGSWLCLWLTKLGANVKGFSLSPNSTPSLYEILNLNNEIETDINDIRNISDLKKSINNFKPDIIFHLAAQPLVRDSYIDPVNTYSTNISGTINILEAIRNTDCVRSFVNITTDKCYENKEWHWGYRENESLGGFDPYSSSKACSEIITSAYRQSFFNHTNINIASARAGNVIGGGDWSKDRLIPDSIRAFSLNKSVIVRNPNSTRPWQHVLEPLRGYLILAEKLFNDKKFTEAWNFGPNESDCRSVEWVLNKVVKAWGDNAKWELDKNSNPHEAQSLKLDCSKANFELNWQPVIDLNLGINMTIDWYKAYYNNINMLQYSLEQIKNFENN